MKVDPTEICERFLRWWLGELAGLLPARLRNFVGERRERLVLTLTNDELTATLHSVTEHKYIGVIALSDCGQEEFGTLLAAAALTKRPKIFLRLDQAYALVRRINLPRTSQKNLRALLAFEIDRQTPMSPSEIYFGYRITDRRNETKTMTVELVIVKRTTLDPVLLRIIAGGYGLREITVAGSPVNLLPPGQQRFRISRRQIQFGGLVALFFALAIGLIEKDISRRDSLFQQLQSQLREAKKQADEVAALKQEIDALAKRMALISSERNAPLISNTLEEVAKLLPDTAWLTGLTIEGSSIHFNGYTAEASNLTQKMIESGHFRDVKFPTPLTRSPDGKTDRFELTMEEQPPSGGL